MDGNKIVKEVAVCADLEVHVVDKEEDEQFVVIGTKIFFSEYAKLRFFCRKFTLLFDRKSFYL
jgi:hypothetical protein